MKLTFAVDVTSSTALHYATFKGHYKAVKLLIKSGANVNLQDRDGSTPLHHAAFFGSKDIVEYLINHKADINIRDVDGGNSKKY